ncbi:hypothetical protein CJ030_MR4G020623 [Morella rubra]|uniref:Uncharacterized protein n=1 Tax=Morella rubra TaxID=262757 RepID=A0A6A1VBF4_9ROSI|nr:hypothetical protein CJ030_MR6G024600 [Morella rubra]KAB1216752.1 hypothetical protein CJ030_MR4G020623 [Morella rubra]
MEAERNRERMVSNKARTVKLFCPSLSKTVLFVAWDEQRLDLGSIARNFGLDPATLKLNGHFIGRGVDFIASSVTWNTLLSFFSARGLPTGKDDQDALVVDGKLSKVGTKRPHDPRDAVNGRCNVTEYEAYGHSRKPQPEDVNLLENKKLKETNLGSGDLHGLGVKRKQLLDDVSQFKRLKINENHSGEMHYLHPGSPWLPT